MVRARPGCPLKRQPGTTGLACHFAKYIIALALAMNRDLHTRPTRAVIDDQPWKSSWNGSRSCPTNADNVPRTLAGKSATAKGRLK